QVINAGLYLLKEEIVPKEDVKSQRTIQQMNNAVLRATGFLNSFLNFSRPFELKIGQVNINELIKGALNEVPEETLSNIEVKQELSSELPKISVDFDLLKQVVVNLVKNAAEAMGEGGKLWIRSTHISGSGGLQIGEKDFVQITFEDSGPGIPEEDLPRIFDPFFTTKGKGTGLGLAICQRIIEAHKGEIEVKSKVGIGTTFTIRLPNP
ncbi:MAG: ATP-binding protein, partial [bacterium]